MSENNPLLGTDDVQIEQDTQSYTGDGHHNVPGEFESSIQQSSGADILPTNNDNMLEQYDSQSMGDMRPLATNNDNDAAIGQNESKSSEAGEVEEEGDKDDDGGEGVKTYSGYQPISQISWDWEPPTSLDREKKAPPPSSEAPQDTRQRQDYSGDGDRDYSRKPVETLVYTEAGEKAKPTPYIREIKARKFDKRPKNKLFVGGLTFEATNNFLYEQFEKYGEIDDAYIVTEKGTGKSRGFGYVTFFDQQDAEEAIKAIDGLRIHGKTLCVEFADDPKSGPRGRGRGGFRGGRSPPRGRGYPPGRGRHYDMDRYPDRDPYYDRGPDPYYRRGGDDPYYDRPPPRDYDRPPPRDYDRPPPRDYDRPPPRDYYDHPPPRDHYDRPPPRDYERPPPRDYDRPPPRDYYDRAPPRDYDRPPPPRDYYDRPPPRDPVYDRPPPRDYDDYRKPPAPYDDRYPPAQPRRRTMTDLDVARLRVDRDKVRREKHTSVDQQRLLARERKKKSPSSSSSSSDSSDTEAEKPKKRHRVIPKAYMM